VDAIDIDYLRNGTKERQSSDGIPIGTYTHTLLSSVVSYDLEYLSNIFSDRVSQGLSATAELLVCRLLKHYITCC